MQDPLLLVLTTSWLQIFSIFQSRFNSDTFITIIARRILTPLLFIPNFELSARLSFSISYFAIQFDNFAVILTFIFRFESLASFAISD